MALHLRHGKIVKEPLGFFIFILAVLSRFKILFLVYFNLKIVCYNYKTAIQSLFSSYLNHFKFDLSAICVDVIVARVE